jgi:hypothetical protein
LRELPTKTDAEVVFEIGRYLDQHGKSTPVSMFGARAVLRDRLPRAVPDNELQQLLVEMCATRGLSLLFDDSDLKGD